MRVYPDWGDRFPLRVHEENGKASWALFSPCERYRYRLRREWGVGPVLCYLMLNPSTADEVRNDPTVERCERRSRALGYDGFEVVNIFALRSTDPKALYRESDPIGPENDRSLLEAVEASEALLLAWGAHGRLGERGVAVRAQLKGRRAYHLGLTKSGEPRHPLYVSYAQALIEINL